MEKKDIEINEYLEKEENPDNFDELFKEKEKKDTQENQNDDEQKEDILFDEQENTVINEVFLEQPLQKSKKPKSEDDLRKEKAFTFAKIAILAFVFLIVVFLITLVIRTLIKQNTLEDRKVIDTEFKTVKLEDNPTDFWKKHMEFKLDKQKEDQEIFKEEVKQELSKSRVQTNESMQILSENINEKIESSNIDISSKIGNLNQTLSSLNEQLKTNKNETDLKIQEVRKFAEEKQSTLDIKLPPLKPIKQVEVPKITYEEEIVFNEVTFNAPTKEPEKEKEEDKQILLPSGFVQVITYTGIKGPTGSKGTSEVHPVRMEIMGKLLAANGEELDLNECYLRGAAKGDITTLRNLITLSKIYCTGIDKKGKFYIEENVSGQVHDELDGALGFPGVLVDSAGKILTRELSLAVIQGAAQMFNQTENIIVPSTGAFSGSNTSFGQEFQSGVGSGVAKGLEGISQYWRDILKGYYPFVDSKAARVGKAFIEIEGKPFNKKYYSDFKLDEVSENKNNWKSILN